MFVFSAIYLLFLSFYSSIIPGSYPASFFLFVPCPGFYPAIFFHSPECHSGCFLSSSISGGFNPPLFQLVSFPHFPHLHRAVYLSFTCHLRVINGFRNFLSSISLSFSRPSRDHYGRLCWVTLIFLSYFCFALSALSALS